MLEYCVAPYVEIHLVLPVCANICFSLTKKAHKPLKDPLTEVRNKLSLCEAEAGWIKGQK